MNPLSEKMAQMFEGPVDFTKYGSQNKDEISAADIVVSFLIFKILGALEQRLGRPVIYGAGDPVYAARDFPRGLGQQAPY